MGGLGGLWPFPAFRIPWAQHPPLRDAGMSSLKARWTADSPWTPDAIAREGGRYCCAYARAGGGGQPQGGGSPLRLHHWGCKQIHSAPWPGNHRAGAAPRLQGMPKGLGPEVGASRLWGQGHSPAPHTSPTNSTLPRGWDGVALRVVEAQNHQEPLH